MLKLSAQLFSTAAQALSVTGVIWRRSPSTVNRHYGLTTCRRAILTLRCAEIAGPSRRSCQGAQTARANGFSDSGSRFEPPVLIAGFHDVAVMDEAVEERGRHLGVAEHAGPFAESQVRRDDDRGPLVEPADQVEQQLTARLREREVTQLIHDQEVQPAEQIGHACLAFGAGDRDSMMRFSGSRAAASVIGGSV